MKVMKYDFSSMTQRRNTNSVKWDLGAEHELPMWVADMDFVTAPAIVKAVQKKAESGLWGYTLLPDAWSESIISWWKNRHQLTIEKDWLMFAAGIVPAVSSAVRALTAVGEKVLLQSPVYNAFYHCICDNGRIALESQLVYENGEYRIDFDDLEKKLADPLTTVMILCNPHNPIGKIWDRETLLHINELCRKHHVLVFADEIHCDLTDPGYDYVPFASVSEECKQNSVTFLAPTKTFNIAGLKTSAVFAADEVIRQKVSRALELEGVSDVNAFAVDATIAAFTEGGEWLDELRVYLAENKKVTSDFLQKELPMLHLVPSHATYLLWTDCGAVTDDAAALCAFLREKTGLFLNEGNAYGTGGETFVRMNIACQRERLLDGLGRLKDGITACLAEKTNKE